MNYDDETGNIGQYGEEIGQSHSQEHDNTNRLATKEEALFMGLSDGLAKAQKAYNKMTKAEHQIENGDNIQAEMDLGFATRDLSNALQDISDQAIEFKQRIEPEAREKPEADNWADRMKASQESETIERL